MDIDMDTGFAIYAIFGICLGLFGLYCAGKGHRH